MMGDDDIDIEQYGFGPEGPRGGATDAQIYQAYKERLGELDLDPFKGKTPEQASRSEVASIVNPESDLNLFKNTGEANWRQTYSISEVGEDFVNRHCYFELIGPKGHFYNEAIRGFVCYWGEYLNYNWHSHEAEEIYYILGGKALFKTKTMTKVLKANETQFHKSWESHAMETLEEPLLAFILWRGKGLDQLAKMDN